MHRLCAIIFALWLSSCASSLSLTPESDLAAIVEDARTGRVDICRDPRWPAWRFGHGEEGLTRLNALRRQARTREETLATTADVEPYDWAEQRARLAGLQSILRAVVAAPGEGQWRSTFDAQEARVAARRAEASAITGSGFSDVAARQNVWRRAEAEATYGPSASGVGSRGVAMCLYARDEARADADAIQLVIAALGRGHWPSDAKDGHGATRQVLSLRSTAFGKAYLKRNLARLDAAAARRLIPRGGWAYLRSGFDRYATPRQFARGVLRDTKLVRAFFASLPPARSVAEELYRRLRVDQFAMGVEMRLWGEYPRNPINDRVWKRLRASTDLIVRENAERVKALLRTRDWFDDARDGHGASRDGWVLVQHADHDPAFQRDVLRRMEPLLASGRVARADYAYLWDRVAVAEKRPQRYGSQMDCKDGQRVARGGLEEPERVDARRAEMGMGRWSDYAASFDPCP